AAGRPDAAGQAGELPERIERLKVARGEGGVLSQLMIDDQELLFVSLLLPLPAEAAEAAAGVDAQAQELGGAARVDQPVLQAGLERGEHLRPAVAFPAAGQRGGVVDEDEGSVQHPSLEDRA